MCDIRWAVTCVSFYAQINDSENVTTFPLNVCGLSGKGGMGELAGWWGASWVARKRRCFDLPRGKLFHVFFRRIWKHCKPHFLAKVIPEKWRFQVFSWIHRSIETTENLIMKDLSSPITGWLRKKRRDAEEERGDDLKGRNFFIISSRDGWPFIYDLVNTHWIADQLTISNVKSCSYFFSSNLSICCRTDLSNMRQIYFTLFYFALSYLSSLNTWANITSFHWKTWPETWMFQ